MWCARVSVARMPKMIQIRNVPDEVHRELKIRAAREGMTLTDYLLREITKVAARPPVEEVLDRIGARSRPQLDEEPEETVRRERETR